eukprot:Seg4629.1 transcript_id=Seg4629.1/GoldUCD/mRNA.D3Y31 product="Retrovirus-related Pol polyprotein from transposon gypsy" pseudo=true protein_id=Seg4629.1/GoldUCD/D3Y31
MPFGMVNSAATLVRAIRKLLAGLDNVDSYIDDILIHTRTWEEHMQALRELFSPIASPLSDLTKKGLPNEVEWNDAHEKAYGTLKKMTVTKPVLRLPEITKPLVLRTDASNTGIGAVLLQENYFQSVMQTRNC